MNTDLLRKVGGIEQDNLIVKLTPAAETFGVTIRKLSAKGTLKRGTILAKSSTDGKLVILGTTAGSSETLTPYCILADDCDVGTTSDAAAVAYRSGNFNRSAVIVNSGYTLKSSDEDELRKNDIIFTDVM